MDDAAKRKATFRPYAQRAINEHGLVGYTEKQLMDILEDAYCRGRDQYVEIETSGGDPRHHTLNTLVNTICVSFETFTTEREFLINVIDALSEEDSPKSKVMKHAMMSLANSLGIEIVKPKPTVWTGKVGKALPHSRKLEPGGG